MLSISWVNRHFILLKSDYQYSYLNLYHKYTTQGWNMNYVTSRISCISSSKSSLPIPTHTLSNTHTISIPVPYPYPYPWPYPTHTLPYPYPSIPYPIPYQIIICYFYVGRKDFFFYNNKTLGFFLFTKNYLLTLKKYFLNFKFRCITKNNISWIKPFFI